MAKKEHKVCKVDVNFRGQKVKNISLDEISFQTRRFKNFAKALNMRPGEVDELDETGLSFDLRALREAYNKRG